MPKTDPLVVRYSSGRGKNLGKTKEHALPIERFIDLFREPHRTGERTKEYDRMSEDDQKTLKGVAGWFFRAQTEGGVRNAKSARPSDVLTFDFDYPSEEYFERMLNREIMPGIRWWLHTSRRHRPGKPRFRLFVPTPKPLPNDLYMPVSRIVAKLFDPDMEFVDRVSFRPAQLMFMPTASKDQEFIFFENNPGSYIDWQSEVEDYVAVHGDYLDVNNLPKTEGERLRVTAEKMEDPTEKKGPVGDFCRAFDIFEAIDHFDLPYDPVDGNWTKPRYTYREGTTTNGVEVHEDGLFLTSYHGSDPVGDMTVNAFDLVRIHLYGEADEDADLDKPIAQRPSWKNMMERIQDEPAYIAQVVASRYDMDAINEDFDEADANYNSEDDEPVEVEADEEDEIEDLVGQKVEATAPQRDAKPDRELKKAVKPKPKKDWISDLELTMDGKIISNLPNVAQIFANDLRIRDSIEYNEFTKRVVTRRSLRTKLPYIHSFHVQDPVNGEAFEDGHMISIRGLLESPNGAGKVGYGLRSVADRDIKGAVVNHALANAFHPVREYLNARDHDGEARAESMFIDYLGCPDTPYYRAAARLWLIAAVTRAFEPGHKFDYVPILSGPQGIRKSSFFRVLAKDWFGELASDFGNDKAMVEAMAGHWIMEMPELSSMTRSTNESCKHFISSTSTQVRLSYAQWESVHLRQCIFAGTTNDETYLLDKTGNRRFWPIPVMVSQIDTDKLAANVDQIWAEAMVWYREMREAQPKGTLPLYMKDEAAQAEAMQLQEAARVPTEADAYADLIRPWLDQEVLPDDYDDFSQKDAVKKHRAFVTIADVWTLAMENAPKLTQTDSRQVGAALRLCGWQPHGMKRFGDGVRKVFIPTDDTLRRWGVSDRKEVIAVKHGASASPSRVDRKSKAADDDGMDMV